MAVKIKVVTETLVAVGNTQDFTDSAFSGDVKGAICLMSYSGDTGIPDSDDGAVLCIGFMDSAGAQVCVSTLSRHNATTSYAFNRFHGTRFLYGDYPTGGRFVEATASTLSNGVRLDFGGLGVGFTAKVTVILLGGDCVIDVIEDIIDKFEGTHVPVFSGVDLTDQDRAAVLCIKSRNEANTGSTLANFQISFGCIVNDGSDTQACIEVAADHDIPGGDTAVYYNTGVMGSETNSSVAGTEYTITGSNFTATGLDIDHSATPDSEYMGLMAIHLTGEDRLALKTFATPTSGSGDTDYTGLGFSATHVFGCGSNHSGAGGITLDAGCAMTLWAWDDDGNQVSHNAACDQTNPTDNISLVSSGVDIIDAQGNRDDQGDKSGSQHADGFTINWASVDATARNCWALAFGVAGGAGGSSASLRGMESVSKIGAVDGISGYWP